MIQPKSVIIGISITIIIVKYFEFYIFKSELLSSLVYIITFSFLYDIVSNMLNKNNGVILEGHVSATHNKKEGFQNSDSFKGIKPGYVFKKDDKGLGYYLDN
tara:strand:- start:127 stop:432 length:306 start_codon:yes stop_codon:yes gene_type:complete